MLEYKFQYISKEWWTDNAEETEKEIKTKRKKERKKERNFAKKKVKRKYTLEEKNSKSLK